MQILNIIGLRRMIIGMTALLFIVMLLNGAWLNALFLGIIAIIAYMSLQNVRSFLSFKAHNGIWRYGSLMGAGLLIAMIAAWSLLGWTTIIFVLGALAVSLASYAIVLSLQRMSIPNSVINVTTDVWLRAPRFRKWGRYVLKAEIVTEISTAKGKTKRLHTKRMHVKVHRDDFPEGRLVEACHGFVQNFVEKERLALQKSYPDTPLMVDSGYLQQVRSLPVIDVTPVIPQVQQAQPQPVPANKASETVVILGSDAHPKPPSASV
ncbi:hypothetical protein TI04_11635 [Achromatium sp. WMS2]|nr:hypothetical protein TI04_11635 [Achromatium sp. WMS2]